MKKRFEDAGLAALIKGNELAGAATDMSVATSESYGDETALRLFVQSIPYIGPRIDFLLTAFGLRARRDRMIRFVEDIKRDLDDLQVDKVDRNFVESPEFEGVLERVLRRSTTTSRDEKLRILRQALLGSMSPQFSSDPVLDSFIQAVEVLSPQHVRLLEVLRIHSQNDGVHFTGRPVPVLFDLVGRGFAEYVPTEGAVLRAGRSDKYRITILGSEFLSFLNCATEESNADPGKS